jgi:hypothetical protein
VLYVAFGLLFSVVLGAVGLARHIGWLMDSREPLSVERVNHLVELRLAVGQMETALRQGDGRLAQTREAFFASGDQGSTHRPTFWERHHLLFFPGQDGKLAAVAVFPRDPRAFAQVGLALIRSGHRTEFQPMTNLPALLSRLESLKRD